MSSINFALRPNDDKLFVFSDTACYLKDGRVGAWKSKISLGERFAVCTMGDALAGMFVQDSLLSDFGSFDELIEVAPSRFNDLVDEQDVAVAVGGWSDARGRFEVWYGRSTGQQFARMDLPAGYGGQPALTNDQWQRGFGKPMRTAAQILNVEDFVKTVLELQREKRNWGNEHPDCSYPPMVSLVGGEGQLATISRDDASIKTVVRWEEDQIGARIEPRIIDWDLWRRTHAVQADPAPAANAPRLSRHKRRAGKAKARRAA